MMSMMMMAVYVVVVLGIESINICKDLKNKKKNYDDGHNDDNLLNLLCL